MTKQEVISLLDQYPEEVDTEELIYGLYLKAKLERAEAAVQRGEVLSHEVIKRSQEWSTSLVGACFR